MTETQIAIVIKSTLDAAFLSAGRSDILVAQGRNPIQQDIGTSSAIFFSPVSSAQNVTKREEYDENTLTRSNIYTTRHSYQFDGFKQSKDDQTETAYDIARLASYIIQSHNTLRTLSNSGINIEKIETVRRNWFQNESGGWDEAPSFDLSFYTETTIPETFNNIDEFRANVFVIN